MTDETPTHPAGLASSRKPTAIVHEGFFVYANPAFLERLGYPSLGDLQSIPLLDLVDDTDHERLREHLDAAKKAAESDPRHPRARLALRRADDLPLAVECTAFRTHCAGEDCIQLSLESRGRAGTDPLPWRLYLSTLFLILFTAVPALSLLRLTIDNAPSVYFPDDEPAVVLDRELRSRFPSDQVFFLVFEGVALYSDGFLAAYDGLGRRIRELPLVDDVISVTNQDHIRGSEDAFIVERLIDLGRLAETRPEDRVGRIMSDRFSRQALVARDGSALGMVVIPETDRNSLDRLQLERAILAAVDQARLGGYLRALAGWVPVDVAQFRSMLSDNAVFIPATIITGLLLIWWLFRRWLAVVLAGVAIGVVVNTTVAIYVVLGQPFTLVSSIISPMLSALTVAALVHLFNALYQASRQGYAGRERVEQAVRRIERPALFAALTTAAGLASLGTSPIVPIKVFGLISACGVGLIYLVVYRVLPNLCAHWDRRPWPRVSGGLHAMDSVVRALSHFGMRRPLVVLLAVAALLGAGIPQLWQVEVETSFQEFFSPDHETRRDTRYVDEHFVGTMPLEVMFNSPGRDGLVDHERLAQIRDFQHWVQTLPQVDRALSMVDFVEEMHWAFNAEDPQFRILPTDSELISQYLLVYDGEDLHDFVDRDLQHSHVALNLNVHSANEISAVIGQIRAYLNEHIDDRLQWEIAGAGRLFADMEELLVAGQVYSLWGALALIFVFMLLLWRSPGAAALCMIPNLSPILLIFICMGLFGIWLDMATAMIASVAVGIAVDDTIHVYHGFRHRLGLGVRPVVALARSYREAGRAVVVTTLILSAQFLILVWSDFLPTRNFGLLTTVGLVTALLFDLLLLPALLMVLHGDKGLVAWLARAGAGAKGPRQPSGGAEVAFDTGHWTAERRVALIREILSGRASTAAAASEFGLPEDVIEHWLAQAEQGIAAALADGDQQVRDPEKFRKLARAYRRLKAENRALKTRREG